MTPIVQVRDGRRSRLVAAAVAGAFALLFLLLLPRSAHAANATWPQNTALVLTGPGITLQIDANSTASSLSVTSTTFTVVTGATDSFVVRYVNPAGKLTNDGAISECNTQAGGDNLATVGPSKSITFTPSTVSCGSGGSSGGGGGSVTPTVSVVLPNGGENLASGTNSAIQWQTNGGSISTMRLWLSTDSGVTYPTLIAQNESNDGSYTWAVPTITTTTHARIKVEAMSGTGSVLSSDTSNADFTITGTAPTTTPPAETPPGEKPPVTTPVPATDSSVRGVYRAIEAISHNPTINDDKGLAAVQAVAEKHCTSGDLIKASQASVYYCGSDGRRYVFVNEKAFKTWFADFKSVKTLTDAELAAIAIGGNVTYRPGVRMIKIQSDPKVYAISRGGLLRWVQTENAAKTLYGADWNKKIDDVSDAFFVNYKIGDDIKDSDVDPSTAPPTTSTATSATVTSASTSATTSCTVAAPFTAYLSSGSSDPEVAPLQGLLQCLGYIPAGTSLTGYYGAATESAVKQFQKANALSQVGYVGPSTREKLNQFVK